MQADQCTRSTSPRSRDPESGRGLTGTARRLTPVGGAPALRGSTMARFPAFFCLFVLIGSACSLPSSIGLQTQPVVPSETPGPAETRDPTQTAAPSQTPESTEAPPLEPSATPAAALLGLEILEWSEFPYTTLADPTIKDTHVEVLIRNPNDVPVRVLSDGAELRFLDSSGAVVYANAISLLYFWEGSWMLPGGIGALSVCVCFQTDGIERKDWQSLELVAPLEVATDLAYTLDVEVTLGEFFSLAEAHLAGSGLGAEITLANRSEHVLESIPHFVFARDTSGRYIGIAAFGNAVVSFTEDINIQPGDTASGIVASDIDYFDEPMTYEVRAIGIIADLSAPTPIAAPAGTPVADWQGIPIMPGALNGGEAEGGYRYATEASIDAIKDFYGTALEELGYSLTQSGDDSGVAYLVFEKGATTVIVAVLPSAERHLVQIAVTP